MPNIHIVDGVEIPYTAEEEIERDAWDAQGLLDIADAEERQARFEVLDAKLADDSITFEEMKELIRMRG